MTQALEAPVQMLSKGQVPAADTIGKLNERLAAWAKDKKNVIMVPLADLCRRMQSNDELKLRDTEYKKGELKALLQNDWLHTNVEGTSALWVLALDRLYAHEKGLAEDAVMWKPKELAAKVMKAAADGKITPAKPRSRQKKAAPESQPAGAGKS